MEQSKMKQLLIEKKSIGLESALEEASILTAEAQGNLEHIYSAIRDLRDMCVSRTNNELVDKYVSSDFINELKKLLDTINN